MMTEKPRNQSCFATTCTEMSKCENDQTRSRGGRRWLAHSEDESEHDEGDGDRERRLRNHACATAKTLRNTDLSYLRRAPWKRTSELVAYEKVTLVAATTELPAGHAITSAKGLFESGSSAPVSWKLAVLVVVDGLPPSSETPEGKCTVQLTACGKNIVQSEKWAATQEKNEQSRQKEEKHKTTGITGLGHATARKIAVQT